MSVVWPLGAALAMMVGAMIPVVIATGIYARRKNWRDTTRMALFVLAELIYVLWFLHDRGVW